MPPGGQGWRGGGGRACKRERESKKKKRARSRCPPLPPPLSPSPSPSLQRASIAAAAPAHPTLAALVAADVAAGVASTRGSAARNLHRVGLALSFLAELLAALASEPGLALRAAAGPAYAATLATCHTGILRAGVRAALYLLPDRAAFMASLGETEASAAAASRQLVPSLRAVVARVEALYAGAPAMPVSEVKWIPKNSAGGKRAEAGA